MASALLETIRSCREAMARQDARIASTQRDVAAVLSNAERLYELQQQLRELETRFDEEKAMSVEKHAERARELETLQNEIRERIQHLLDEQRVSVRQISLQTSEEAVLVDRARRATELRLDELSRKIEKLVKKS
jgi:uncharacterized membrane-anchored protein YhcB (DUF1043 family)